MKERDLAILVVKNPEVTYRPQDGGLYLTGSSQPLALLTIDSNKPDGYAVLNSSVFADLADDPDVVAAGPVDIIVQNAIGARLSSQEVARRLEGMRQLLTPRGYLAISASQAAEAGEVSAQTIQDACSKLAYALLKEQPIVYAPAHGIARRCMLGIYRKH